MFSFWIQSLQWIQGILVTGSYLLIVHTIIFETRLFEIVNRLPPVSLWMHLVLKETFIYCFAEVLVWTCCFSTWPLGTCKSVFSLLWTYTLKNLVLYLCFVCRFIQRSTLAFLQSNMAKPLLCCAIAACSLDHKDANASVMKFLTDFIKCAHQKEVTSDWRVFCSELSSRMTVGHQ